jgi:hypothetical protein
MATLQRSRIDWSQVPVHPFFFAAHPILFLYARNAAQMTGVEVWRPLWVSLAATGVLYAWLRLALKEFWRAALVLTVVVYLFFEAGLLSKVWYRLAHLDVLVAWSLLVVALSVMVVRRRVRPPALTRFLNLTGLFLVGMCLCQIAVSQAEGFRGARALRAHYAEATPPPTLAPTMGYAPDIYYVILDGYGRADVLKDLYGKEGNHLADYLGARGFYVAPAARSNYGQTALSLASSLNMEYLDYLAEDKGVAPQDRRPLITLMRDSRVAAVLRSLGYTVVLYPSVYVTQHDFKADAVIAAPGDDGAGIFEVSVAEMTPLPEISRKLNDHASVLRFFLDEPDVHRMRTEFALDALGRLPDHGKPLFVFAHVLCPHPPFIFNRMGATKTHEPPGFGDGAPVAGDSSTYRQRYEAQMAYLNTRAREIVDRILASSKRPPIIIFQGDHGPGSKLVWAYEPGSVTSVDLRERMSILNAYYLPAGGQAALYPGISPVNTFRVIFNHYFGARYPLLPDRSFFSAFITPYRFIEYGPANGAAKPSSR